MIHIRNGKRIRTSLSLFLAVLLAFTAPCGAHAYIESDAYVESDAFINETVQSDTRNEPLALDSDGHMGGRTIPKNYREAEIVDKEWTSPVLLGLPSSFDLRSSLGGSRVTSVKDQGNYGTCWAHAVAASAESNLLMRGSGSYNLSETQLAYFTYNRDPKVIVPPTNRDETTGDTVSFVGDGGVLNRGGNTQEAISALAGWIGFANESDAPYSRAGTVNQSGMEARLAYAADSVHLQKAMRVNSADRNLIKEYLRSYGAATIEYVHSDYFYNSSTAAYYIKSSLSNANSGEYLVIGGGHEVTLIGWDDNFSASNFSPYTPPGNGAWLCKNSWGTGWGKSGYYWISYYDASIGDIYFLDVAKNGDYDYLYQYDGGSFSELYTTSYSTKSEAAVFTAGSNEKLCAVGFYAENANLNVTINAYTNLTDERPSADKLVSSATATHSLKTEGYYTLPFARPVDLDNNSKFAVSITVTNPSGVVRFCYDISSMYEQGVNSIVSAEEGQTFISTDGIEWVDMTDYYRSANLRIKAMTISENSSVAGDFQPGDVTLDGSVTLADAVLLARYIAGFGPMYGALLLRGDVNADGSITVADVILICRYLAGVISLT